MPKGYAIQYSDEMIAFLHENKLMTRKDLTCSFNAKFGTNINQLALTAKCTRIRATTGRTGRFEKGVPTWNKGVKNSTGFSETRFKKGDKPRNTRPDFSERVCSKDGYRSIKIDGNYVHKHRWLWEQSNGKIPDGYHVAFKNKDRTDIRLENLILVSQKEMATLNKTYSKMSNPETQETLILLSKVRHARPIF